MAKEHKALIFDFGDTFDAMQGKFDPRRTLEEVRPEHKTNKYYDVIVDDTADNYADYADNFAMFSRGNHETAVLDKVNTDLISKLVHKMNTEHTGENHRIFEGGYGGYIRFMFTMNKTRRQQLVLKYHHGSGGTAPVTRGVIQTNRQAVFSPDADIVVNGHNHQAYIMPIPRERISTHGKIFQDVQWHIRTPGYKNDWIDGHEGWAVERNTGPTPHGSVWLEFSYEQDKLKVKAIPEIE